MYILPRIFLFSKKGRDLKFLIIIILEDEEYILMTSGDVLGDILDDCSKSTPEDPILYVADSLER